MIKAPGGVIFLKGDMYKKKQLSIAMILFPTLVYRG